MTVKSTKKVLRKVSNEQKLNQNDKEVIDDLITVLKRAKKKKKLSHSDKKLIESLIEKTRAGILTPLDVLNVAANLFQIAEFFKDTS